MTTLIHQGDKPLGSIADLALPVGTHPITHKSRAEVGYPLGQGRRGYGLGGAGAGRCGSGDERVNRRRVCLAEALSADPTASIPQACQGWAETQAAYRFFGREALDGRAILQPQWACTEARMRACPRVLCPQDATELDFTPPPGIAGLGRLSYEHRQGLYLHPTLALMTAILAREEHPPAGERPVEWRLLTNAGLTTFGAVCGAHRWVSAQGAGGGLLQNFDIGLPDRGPAARYARAPGAGTGPLPHRRLAHPRDGHVGSGGSRALLGGGVCPRGMASRLDRRPARATPAYPAQPGGDDPPGRRLRGLSGAARATVIPVPRRCGPACRS